MKKDLYQVLAANKEASPAEIEQAYRLLLDKYNALYNQGNQEASHELFNIKGAYEVLSNTKKREAYDKKLDLSKTENNSSIATTNPLQNETTHDSSLGNADKLKSNSKLSKCKTCGHDVSTTAKTCQNCGESNPAPNKSPGFLAVVVSILFVFFVIGMFRNL